MKRLYLTRREYNALLETQGGVSCVAGCGATEDLIAEHSTPNALSPGKPDQLMCKACHKVKTLRDVNLLCFVMLHLCDPRAVYCGASSPVHQVLDVLIAHALGKQRFHGSLLIRRQGAIPLSCRHLSPRTPQCRH